MKKLVKKLSILTLVALISFFGCKDNFKEINTDPNAMEKALPQTLLAPAVTTVVKSNMVRCRAINNELMQVTVDMGDTDYKVFRYDIRGTLANFMWNEWYVELANLKDVYLLANERLEVVAADTYNRTYMGISLVLQSWVFANLTDIYGDIPYSEALRVKEGIIYPKYDSQQAIYQDIFAKLEEANNLFKGNVNLPDGLTFSDPVYAGNALKWRKFCNSLYLRLLLRVSAKESSAVDKIKDILGASVANYPVFANNDDSAILKWTGEIPYQSPFHNWTSAQWIDPKLTEFFVDNLKIWADPRLRTWASTYSGGYFGIPGGYPIGAAPVAKSRFLVSMQSHPLLGNIINYAELQFIMAEAAARGWISGSAKTYYDNGITAGITLWGNVVPTGYVNKAVILYNETADLEEQLEQIHLQKYYALFYTDFQQWFEHRRTGHPVLPKGAGLENNGIMPARLNYPVYLNATNKQNLLNAIAAQGPDDINTKVWWQKP